MIQCEPKSLAGEIDKKAIQHLEKYRKFKFHPAFLDALPLIHGGIPKRQYFTSPRGNTYRVGRFLTLFDEKSKLPPPFQPDWEFDEYDVRDQRSIFTLIDQEGPSCQLLFSGERVIPFAALYRGQNHPDGMSLTSADCDLVCFDNASPPGSIVVWHARLAGEEYCRLDDDDESLDEAPNYDAFLEPVAESFSAFARMLTAVPASAPAEKVKGKSNAGTTATRKPAGKKNAKK